MAKNKGNQYNDKQETKFEKVVEETLENNQREEIPVTQEVIEPLVETGEEGESKEDEEPEEENPLVLYKENVFFRDEVQKARLTRLINYIEVMGRNKAVTVKQVVDQHQNLFALIGFLLSSDMTVQSNIEDIQMAGKMIEMEKNGAFHDSRLYRNWNQFMTKNPVLREEALVVIGFFVNAALNTRPGRRTNWDNFIMLVRPQRAETFIGALRKSFNIK